MFFGEQSDSIGMYVVLPRQHEVNQERHKADGQQNVAKCSASGGDNAGQTSGLMDLNRDWLFDRLWRGDHGPCALFNLFGLRSKARNGGMNFARVLWQLGGKIDGATIKEVYQADGQRHHQQYC